VNALEVQESDPSRSQEGDLEGDPEDDPEGDPKGDLEDDPEDDILCSRMGEEIVLVHIQAVEFVG